MKEIHPDLLSGSIIMSRVRLARNLSDYPFKVKDVATAKALRSGKNEVFIDSKYTKVNKKTVKMCMDEEIPLEVWTIDSEEEIVALDPYVNGITSDNLIAGKVLCENIMK